MCRSFYIKIIALYLLGAGMSAIALLALTMSNVKAAPVDRMSQWRPTLTREAQAIYGISAPIPMFAGQIFQESGGNEKVTAFDGGMSLAQMMPATAKWLSEIYPDLGAPDPYNPRWSIRALTRYNSWLYKRVKGGNACETWGAVLTGYNGGLGYVQKSQRLSGTPDIWFGKTELISSGQSTKNFVYSREYPRWILYKHQPRYSAWGAVTCDMKNIPVNKLPKL